MVDEWRIVDLGVKKPFTHTIATCSAVAEAIGEGLTSTTIIFHASESPCYTVGVHEDIDLVLDVEKAKRMGVDVARRDVGGGCVFLDKYPGSGVMVCTILDKNKINFDEASKFLLRLLKAGAKAVGALEAEVVGSGDLRWRGRKCGSFTLDDVSGGYLIAGGPFFSCSLPNMDVYLQTAKIPPEKLKDKSIKDPSKYIAPLYEVVGKEIPYDEVRDAYIKAFEKEFDVKLVWGELTNFEKKKAEETYKRQKSDEWLYRKSTSKFREKAPSNSKIGFSTNKYKKLVRVGVAVDSSTNKIVNLMVAGDMYITPTFIPDEIEKTLIGLNIKDENEMLRRIKNVLLKPEVKVAEFHRIEPEEYYDAIKKAIENALTQT